MALFQRFKVGFPERKMFKKLAVVEFIVFNGSIIFYKILDKVVDKLFDICLRNVEDLIKGIMKGIMIQALRLSIKKRMRDRAANRFKRITGFISLTPSKNFPCPPDAKKGCVNLMAQPRSNEPRQKQPPHLPGSSIRLCGCSLLFSG